MVRGIIPLLRARCNRRAAVRGSRRRALAFLGECVPNEPATRTETGINRIDIGK